MAWLDNEIRALSVRPPWADAIVDGHKPVENRRQGFQTTFRGWVVIQASKAWSDRGKRDPRIRDAYPPPYSTNSRGYVLRHGVSYGGRPPDPFLGGYLIGRAELVDVHPAAGCCHPWGEDEYLEDGGTKRSDVAHLVFENPVRFARPVAALGALGLWRPKPHVLADLLVCV